MQMRDHLLPILKAAAVKRGKAEMMKDTHFACVCIVFYYRVRVM